MRNRRAFMMLMAGRGVIPAPANIWTPQGTVIDAAVAAEEGVTQEPNVIYEGGVYKMWYSDGFTTRCISYATSSDGIAWTKSVSNPILNTHTRPFVFKNGSTYLMYAIKLAGGLDKLSSADGIAWAVDASSVIGLGAGGTWDDNSINNVFVWIEGATWYMLYDGESGTSDYQIGLATSADGVAWTKSVSNPVITRPNPGSVGGPWLTKQGNTYYCYAQVSSIGSLPTDIAKYNSTDLITWTRSPAGLTYPRNERSEGVGSNAGQTADVSILEVNGVTYMYYTAYVDGSTASGKVRLATAPYGLDRIVLSAEGVSASYKPNLYLNGGFERLGAGGADIFADITESAGTGTIARTTTAGEFRSGTSGIAAVKLTGGSSFNTYVSQSIPAANFSAGDYVVTGWARGDGTNSPRLRIFDGVDLDLTWGNGLGITSTTFTQFSKTFTYPGSGNLVVYCYCPAVNGGVAYFDDLSVRRIA